MFSFPFLSLFAASLLPPSVLLPQKPLYNKMLKRLQEIKKKKPNLSKKETWEFMMQI